MNKTFITFCMLLGVCLFSCTQSPQEQMSDSANLSSRYELENAGLKEFSIDLRTNYFTQYVDTKYTDSATYLVYENRLKPAIQFYDLEADTLSFEIPLEMEGPDGVGRIRGVYIKSIDSIYVLNSMAYKVFHVNSKGKVLRTYSWINNKEQSKTVSMAGIYTASPAIYKDGKLNMFAVPETGPVKKETFTEGKVNLQLDIESGLVNYNYNYPKLYTEGNYGNFYINISRTLSPQNSIVYSFGADPFLHETNYGGRDISYYAGSNFFEAPKPYKDVNKRDENSIESTKFTGIMYDKFREVYYRIATGGIPLINNQNEKNSFYDKPISIITLSKDFKVLGETLLPEKKHDYRCWFVAENGLYISNSNPKNPDLQEDKLSFTIYRFKEKL